MIFGDRVNNSQEKEPSEIKLQTQTYFILYNGNNTESVGYKYNFGK